jgi:hypothetical protein
MALSDNLQIICRVSIEFQAKSVHYPLLLSTQRNII